MLLSFLFLLTSTVNCSNFALAMKKSDKSNQDESRRTNVLLEEIRGNVKLLAEGHQGIIERIDRIETRIDRIETRIDRIEVNMYKEFANVHKKIDELRKDVTMVLKNHEARLNTLETAKG